MVGLGGAGVRPTADGRVHRQLDQAGRPSPS
jgi:hypothetical protein